MDSLKNTLPGNFETWFSFYQTVVESGFKNEDVGFIYQNSSGVSSGVRYVIENDFFKDRLIEELGTLLKSVSRQDVNLALAYLTQTKAPENVYKFLEKLKGFLV